jgi:hypothetical protein
VKSGSTGPASNRKSAKVSVVGATSTENKLANNTDPLLSQKSKSDALTVELNPPNVKPDAPTVEPNPLTAELDPSTIEPDPSTVEPDPSIVEPDPSTVEPDGGDVLMLDPPDDTVPPDTINESDFEVQGATIKKDDEAALEEEMPEEDTEAPEEIKKRKKREADDEKRRLRTLFGSK